MKKLTFWWLVFQNLVLIVIALLIFKVATTEFQTAVIALLLIIYTEASPGRLGSYMYDQSHNAIKRHVYLLRVLKDRALDGPDAQKHINEIEDHYGYMNIQFTLCNIKDLAIFIIAIWHLIGII